MGSDENHFNISLIVRDKVASAQTTTFEEKGEAKQIQTEVPLLTSLTLYCWAKPAHIVLQKGAIACLFMVVPPPPPPFFCWCF